jgi:hypothetical protein
MDKFLVKYDFQTLIDEDNLNEILDNNDRVLEEAINAAVEKVAGYIRHRYDFDQVFKVVQSFSDIATYAVDDRVFWSPAAYDASSTYALGAIVSYQDNIYECTTAVTVAEPFDPAKWTLRAENNTFYTCTAASTGNLPTDPTYFTAGDNRNALIKEITIDVTLYNIHSKISPRAIPDVRRTRYDGFGNLKEGDSAIFTLMQVQKGTITLDLPVIEPVEQNTERISYGSTPNTNYSY